MLRLHDAVIAAGVLLLGACGLLAQASRAQEPEAPALEPELLGVVYYLDADKGELAPLERLPARTASSGGGFMFGQVKRRIKVPGAGSPVRFPQGQMLEFVVSGGDLQLYPLESKKDRREVVVSKTTVYWVTARSRSTGAEKMLDVTRYGSSVKIRPNEPLPPGEYGFYLGGEMFAFAIDLALPK